MTLAGDKMKPRSSSRSTRRPSSAPPLHLGLHQNALIGHRIPVTNPTIPFSSSLPQPIPEMLASAVNMPNIEPHSSTLFGWHANHFDKRTQLYDITYIIPYHQPTAGKPSPKTHADQHYDAQRSVLSDVFDCTYMYIRLCGHYEHQYYIRHYCRIKTVDARMLLLPAVMSAGDRLAAIQNMVEQRTEPQTSDGEDSGDPNSIEMLHKRANAHYVAMYTLPEASKIFHDTLHPKLPAYVETSAKSKRLARKNELVEGSSSSSTAENMSPLLLAPPATTITGFLKARRQPNKTIDRLSFFGSELVKVRELAIDHVLYFDSGENKTTVSRRFNKPPHPQSIRGQLNSARVKLEHYIHNPNKLAVVAYLPMSHQKVLRLGKSNLPERRDRIVAVSLFTFVPFDKNNERSPAHVRLDGVFVDHQFDETQQPSVSRRNEHYGIHANFVRACMRYVLHVADDHDVVCETTALPVVATQQTNIRKQLLHCGFVPMYWTDKNLHSNEPVRTKNVRPTSSWSLLLWWWNTARKNTSFPPLVYSALTITCKKGDWKACVEKVRASHPTKPFSELLKLASIHYGIAGSTVSKMNKRLPTKRRSRRRVSPAQGAEILRNYYIQKHLGLEYSEPSKLQELAELTGLNEKEDRGETAMNEHPALDSAIRKCCSSIRKHLLRTRKTRPILTDNARNTWKYRPLPDQPVTPNTRSGGPDSYYLDGLDVTTDIGKKTYEYPLGKRNTPKQYVSTSTTTETKRPLQ